MQADPRGKDTPRKMTEPDDRWSKLQMAYAGAMWTWAEVEATLFTIYLAAIGGLHGDMRPERQKFFAPRSFRSRLNMTNAAVTKRWADGKLRIALWEKLKERAEKAGSQRGRIAHKAGRRWAPQKPGQQPLYILSYPFSHPRHPGSLGAAKSMGIDAAKLCLWQHQWHAIGLH